MPVKAKPRPKLLPPKKPPASPLAVGIDLSPSSIAGAAKMFDATLGKMQGPVWNVTRWPKNTPDFEKMLFLSKGHEIIYDLIHQLGGIAAIEDIYIGVEEVPPRAMNAQRQREQALLIGCFVGSLLRYGYQVHFVNNKKWQSVVAGDLDKKLNADWDKWDIKNWAISTYDVPKWKDLIRNSKEGLIPKPKGSKAMPEQPDDRYDALGIMEYTWEALIPKEKHERPRFTKQ